MVRNNNGVPRNVHIGSHHLSRQSGVIHTKEYSIIKVRHRNKKMKKYIKNTHIKHIEHGNMRLITGSEYLAHSEPLFQELELLKIEDLYKLKILKLYYNLSYGLLPSYFNCYLDVLNVNTPCGFELRQSARPKIRLPRTRLIFTESCLLYLYS